jgi:RNA polymerase sigma factor (sigma-70 family)
VKADPRELDLLKGLAINDNMSIELIYRENYPIIQSMIVNNNGSPDEAKDVFQESMIVLFDKARQPGFELTCQVGTYLFSVARRIWLKRLQQAGINTRLSEVIEDTYPVESDVEHHEQYTQRVEMMHGALEKIGEPCRSLLEAYYFKKRNMHDISEDFGYTNADNAKNQKYKCLNRLKKIFFSQYKYR